MFTHEHVFTTSIKYLIRFVIGHVKRVFHFLLFLLIALKIVTFPPFYPFYALSGMLFTRVHKSNKHLYIVKWIQKFYTCEVIMDVIYESIWRFISCLYLDKCIQKCIKKCILGKCCHSTIWLRNFYWYCY